MESQDSAEQNHTGFVADADARDGQVLRPGPRAGRGISKLTTLFIGASLRSWPINVTALPRTYAAAALSPLKNPQEQLGRPMRTMLLICAL